MSHGRGNRAATRPAADSSEAADLEALDRLPYLTAEEAGKLLRIGRHTVYKLVKAGELRCKTIGKRQVFAREEIRRFMSTHDHVTPEPMTPSVRKALAARAN